VCATAKSLEDRVQPSRFYVGDQFVRRRDRLGKLVPGPARHMVQLDDLQKQPVRERKILL